MPSHIVRLITPTEVGIAALNRILIELRHSCRHLAIEVFIQTVSTNMFRQRCHPLTNVLRQLSERSTTDHVAFVGRNRGLTIVLADERRRALVINHKLEFIGEFSAVRIKCTVASASVVVVSMLINKSLAVAIYQEHGITGGHKHPRSHRSVFERLLQHHGATPCAVHITHSRSDLLRHRDEIALSRKLCAGPVSEDLVEALQHIGIMRKTSGAHNDCLPRTYSLRSAGCVGQYAPHRTRFVSQKL